MAPGAKGLFDRVNVADTSSPEFNGHVMRVMGGLDVLVNYLQDLPVLESMLAHLSEQHVVREGVTKAGFGVSIRLSGTDINRRSYVCTIYCNKYGPYIIVRTKTDVRF